MNTTKHGPKEVPLTEATAPAQPTRDYLESYQYRENPAAFDAIAAETPGFDIDKFCKRWADAASQFMFALDAAKGGGQFASGDPQSLTPPATQRDMWLGTLVTQLANALEDTGGNPNVLAIAWEHTETGLVINEGRLFSRILIPALRERGCTVPDLHTILGRPAPEQENGVGATAAQTKGRIDMALLSGKSAAARQS